MNLENIIRLEHVYKQFSSKTAKILAVKDVSLDIKKGEIFGIIGFSGAGKSTLVRCINLLERPTDGAVFFGEGDLMTLGYTKLRKIRQSRCCSRPGIEFFQRKCQTLNSFSFCQAGSDAESGFRPFV